MIRAASLSRAALTEKQYVWRDPARCSPARLAALSARDARLGRRDDDPAPAFEPSEHNTLQAARRAARMEKFAALRAGGMSVAEAGRQLGINRSTARNYARALREAEGGGE